ncbi:MAG: histidine kinase [Bacteroidales bacterium]|nr:histidine kinase [Bacteroidales bacterium]
MKLRRLHYFLLPIIYLIIGGTVIALLTQRILNYASTFWLLLLLPMLMVTVLLTVVGIVNVWLSYRNHLEPGLLVHYRRASLAWLYFRCWAVVMAGMTLGFVFAWMHQLLPDYLRELFRVYQVIFYVFCTFLTLSALMSVVLGVNLEEIRLRNAQSENQLLKAQLNPHFLYNTLNNVDALIWIDQERASSAVTSLSNLMRYMTYSARQEQVPLRDEVQAIGLLCDLQRLRMAKPECLSFEVVGAQSDAAEDPERMIAPLLLVPLVENCFKHCGLTSEADAIRIRLEQGDHQLKFTTDNNLPADVEAKPAKGTPHGVGLTVLRRRLELIYPGSYTFTARREGNRFRTMLTISC